MTPIKPARQDVFAEALAFQSLFFWMTPIKKEIETWHGSPPKFQSLFFWMTPIKTPDDEEGVLDFLVSILVLLDDSHQAPVCS